MTAHHKNTIHKFCGGILNHPTPTLCVTMDIFVIEIPRRLSYYLSKSLAIIHPQTYIMKTFSKVVDNIQYYTIVTVRLILILHKIVQ